MTQEIIDQQTGEVTAVPDAMATILTQRTPPEFVKTRKGRGGKMLSYVSHDYVTRTLNQAFSFQWSFQVVSERLIPEDEPREVVVRARLTVHTPNGDLTKEQFGSANVKRLNSGDIISLGDDFKAASSDALKKCASLLGLALDLYGSDAPQGQPQPRPQRKATNSGQPANGDRPTSPAALLEAANERTNGYYKNAPHLCNALGGSWPKPGDHEGWAVALSSAVDHANSKPAQGEFMPRETAGAEYRE